MSKTVISIENIGKLYRLGEIGTGTLSHDLNRWWARVRGREDPYKKIGQENDRTRKSDTDYIWALDDINLDIHEGDIVGIIGRNGAGKSTLLKLISRITAPTTGCIRIRGRVGSLLEVGTGMHPQMTARENIFLNGAILGMKRHEIVKKFDDIVDFSGCSLYIDTPIKRFSTGMRVRLGFSVAAFLDPEILIVDEVLAVGDAEFQKKCLGKMRSINREEGRTVLFVSHNMTAISNFCSRGIFLEKGSVSYDGSVGEAIDRYLSVRKKSPELPMRDRVDRHGDGRVRFVDLQITNGDRNDNQNVFISGDSIRFKLNYECRESNLHDPLVAIAINSLAGECYLYLSTDLLGIDPIPINKNGSFIFSIPSLPLMSGTYSISAWISFKGQPADWILDAALLTVEEGDFYGSGRMNPKTHGKFLVKHTFETV